MPAQVKFLDIYHQTNKTNADKKILSPDWESWDTGKEEKKVLAVF